MPHYHGHRERLCDRFLKSGLDGFADYEVVELLLTLAIPGSDVKQPAKALVAQFGNLRGILDAPVEELRTVPGIGAVKPVALQIIRAVARLYLQQGVRDATSWPSPTGSRASGACVSARCSTKSSKSAISIPATGFSATVSRRWKKAPSTVQPCTRGL